jgi:hypothetical protein
MTNRRHFLGTLGKALGAGAVLLPWDGKGALAFPADLGKAASLPLTPAPLPLSPECLQLREIKRALAALDQRTCGGVNGPWHRMMVNEYHPAADRLCARPVRNWADCVELAETIWSFWQKEFRDGPYVGPKIDKLSVDPANASVGYHQRHAVVALVEGVLALGDGERFDPMIALWNSDGEGSP